MKKMLMSLACTCATAMAADKMDMVGNMVAVPTKVAFANFNKIFNLEDLKGTADEWQDGVADLQIQLQAKDAEIQKMDQELRKTVAALKNMEKSEVGSQEAREKRTQEAMKMQQEMQMAYQAFEQARVQGLQELFTKLTAKATKVADDLRKQQGWDGIIMSGLVSVDPKFDLTEQILQELNKSYAPEKKKREAAKAAANQKKNSETKK
ncbi:OmpH family outer membrane protein [Candidatus Dependentiae bacterium]|nr:OmpH family outer membrane protein [Candidatus Dependentiae bacterium]